MFEVVFGTMLICKRRITLIPVLPLYFQRNLTFQLRGSFPRPCEKSLIGRSSPWMRIGSFDWTRGMFISAWHCLLLGSRLAIAPDSSLGMLHGLRMVKWNVPSIRFGIRICYGLWIG